jgi:hypothetical protein
MPLLTVSEFRQHVKTTLADTAVQRLLDANEAEINDRFGTSTTDAVEVLYPGDVNLLVLSRPAASITSVVEERYDTDTTLVSDNYRLTPGGWTLERRTTEASPYTTWGDRVVVAYAIADEVAKRRRVLIKLTQFDVENRPGIGSQSTADQAISYSSRLADEREEILRDLDHWHGPVFA